MAAALGRLDDAIALQERAFARDPVSPITNTYLGTLYLHAGRFDEAMAAYRTTLILNPSYIGARFLLGESLLLKGDLGAALDAMQQETDEGYRLIGLVMVHHAIGDAAASDEALASLISKFEQDAPYNIAYTLAYRGEADRAFEWLDKAVLYNDPGLTEVATDPLFAGIRNDPRWLPFLERIGKAPRQLEAIKFDITLPDLR
jgi:tetratricopeptide (TPR) repeat protein